MKARVKRLIARSHALSSHVPSLLHLIEVLIVTTLVVIVCVLGTSGGVLSGRRRRRQSGGEELPVLPLPANRGPVHTVRNNYTLVVQAAGSWRNRLDSCERSQIRRYRRYLRATDEYGWEAKRRRVLSTSSLQLLHRYTVFDATLLSIGGRFALSEFIYDHGVICHLGMLYLNNCDEDGESIVSCARRLGSAYLQATMPGPCRSTNYFLGLTALVDALDLVCGVPDDRLPAADALQLGSAEEARVMVLASLPSEMQAFVLEGIAAMHPFGEVGALLAEQVPVVVGNNTLPLDGGGGGSGDGGAFPVADAAGPSPSPPSKVQTQPPPSFLQRVRDGYALSSAEEAAVIEAFRTQPEDRPRHRMPPPLRCRRKPRSSGDNDGNIKPINKYDTTTTTTTTTATASGSGSVGAVGRTLAAEYTIRPVGFALPYRTRAIAAYNPHKLFEFFPIIPTLFDAPPGGGRFGRSYFDGRRHGLTPLELTEDAAIAHGTSAYELIASSRPQFEWLYTTLLRYSMFAFAHRRGGVDSPRLQEYMHHGAVPVYVDLPYTARTTAPSTPFATTPRTPATVPRAELLRVLDSPMLSHIGQLDDCGRRIIARGGADGRRTGLVIEDRFMKRCNRRDSCNVNFKRPGRLNLAPYRAAHEADIRAGVVPEGTPLTFRAPAVRHAYDEMARPLWDLFGAHYSAAAVANYILTAARMPNPRRVLVISDTADHVSDAMLESVVSGLSDLGVQTDLLVRQGLDNYKRFSFMGVAPEVHKRLFEAVAISRVRELSGDPREVGIVAVEAGRRRADPQGSRGFCWWGRWNPFVVRRGLGAQELMPDVQSASEVRAALVAQARARLVAQAAARQRRNRAAAEAKGVAVAVLLANGNDDDDDDANDDGDNEKARRAGDNHNRPLDIRDYYDLIVYASVAKEATYAAMRAGMTLFDEVIAALPASRIVFIDGEESRSRTQHRDICAAAFSPYGLVFLREMAGFCVPGYEEVVDLPREL